MLKLLGHQPRVPSLRRCRLSGVSGWVIGCFSPCSAAAGRRGSGSCLDPQHLSPTPDRTATFLDKPDQQIARVLRRRPCRLRSRSASALLSCAARSRALLRSRALPRSPLQSLNLFATRFEDVLKLIEARQNLCAHTVEYFILYTLYFTLRSHCGVLYALYFVLRSHCGGMV